VNLQSEITFFSEMGAVDKARLMASFLGELTSEARATYGPAQDSVHDAARLRFTNETCNRVTKLIEQYLGDDKARRPTTWCCACCFRRAPTRWRRRWCRRPIEGRCRTSSATTPRYS
jgi:hypothetical protein